MVSIIFVFTVAFKNIEAKAQQNINAKGKYVYEISGKKVRKINLANGKVSVKNISSSNKKTSYSSCGEVIKYNGYLYYVINTYEGSDCEWNYLCRIKENGKKFEILDKGYDPYIISGKIFYTKVSFNPKAKFNSSSYYTKIKGVYRMKCNGTGKKLVVKGKSILGKYKNTILTFKQYDNGVIGQYSLNGKLLKTIQSSLRYFYDYSMVGSKLLFAKEVQDEATGKLGNDILTVDVVSGQETSESIGESKFLGKTKKNMFYLRNTGSLYISENDKNKKLSNKLYDARIRSNADNKYILVNISKKNYELRYNVLVNKSTGAVKRVSSKYCC